MTRTQKIIIYKKQKAVKVPRSKLVAQKIVRMSVPATTEVKKPLRLDWSIQILRQIRRFQKQTEFAIRKLPFQRLVRQIAHQFKKDIKFQSTTFVALQQAVQSYMVSLFQECNKCTIRAKRVTLNKQDFHQGKRIRGSTP